VVAVTTLLDSLFARDPFFSEFDRLTRSALGERQPDGSVGVSAMPMDVFRRGDDVVLRLDVPGVDPDDIELTVNGRVLTIEAVRRTDEAEGDTYYLRGVLHGRMRRQLTLPDGLALDAVEASCDNGVLTLRLPLTETAKPRRIEIARGARTAEITS
jgi:HSP20 family protein